MLDAFHQSLSYLLPQGHAWPRDPASVWMRLLRGVAASFDELHQFTLQTWNEWMPQSTHTRLGEWEAAVGLPDPCFYGVVQTEDQRRAAVLARLRGPQGEYADSSPAAPGAIERYCETLGFTATVVVRFPFRVGHRISARLGGNDGQMYIRISGTPSSSPEPFRVGRDHVSRRLVERAPEYEQLTCALERVVPARFAINIILE